MRALLDINVLIALFDRNHASHPIASQWLATHIDEGWASSPLTQNGCVRILSQPRYPNPLSINEAIRRLRLAVATPYHLFFPDDISLLDDDILDGVSLSGPSQITDAYLLALAIAHGARFVTLDKQIPLTTAKHATHESLVIL